MISESIPMGLKKFLLDFEEKQVIVAVHQPNYLPYPGFFAKANLCDVFVLYDVAQFSRGDYFNRNRIRTFSANGWMWLTLPVGKKKFEGIPISEVRISDDNIFEKHKKTITTTYSRAPCFDKEICEHVATPHKLLSEHNVFLIKFLMKKLGINARLVLSSELGVPIRHGTHGLIDIVKTLNGTEYISGLGAKTYIEEDKFRKEHIGLFYVAYKPIKYPQIHPEFVEDMSIVDAIFNIGWEDTSSKLKNIGRTKAIDS